MQRIAYIQANDEGHPYSANGAVAARGFSLLGFTVRYFKGDELASLSLTPDTIVVGGVGTVREALAQAGMLAPSHLSIPSILEPYLGRRCWRTTFQELRETGPFPVFVKPYEDNKVFNGRVVKSLEELDALLVPKAPARALSEDLHLLAQDPVEFVSEWRTFVMCGAVVGVSFYLGDPLVLPCAATIRMAVAAFLHAPAGCSVDFGVTKDRRTLLIETNDGYSLGHGGLTPIQYADLLLTRWDEMAGD